jgi:hypothetical protein
MLESYEYGQSSRIDPPALATLLRQETADHVVKSRAR